MICPLVLKSLTIIVLLSTSPFMSVSVCLMYWGAPMLDGYLQLAHWKCEDGKIYSMQKKQKEAKESKRKQKKAKGSKRKLE